MHVAINSLVFVERVLKYSKKLFSQIEKTKKEIMRTITARVNFLNRLTLNGLTFFLSNLEL